MNMELRQAELKPASLQLLGQCVYDLILHLGEHTSASPLENALFREAIVEAISLLSSREQTQTLFQEHGISRDTSQLPPLSLIDLAQAIVDHALSDDVPSLSEDEQLARSEFALFLDPTCTDAYLIQSEISAKRRSYQVARETYEKAIAIAAEQLGPEAFTKKGQGIWHDLESRPYLRTRTALAFLLWQNMGLLYEAIAHFQALLTLNPDDNQGNRFALRCCLLEAGDDTALEAALERFRTSMDTTWHYTYACWRFRHQPPPKDNPLTSEATTALRTAFSYNLHVPTLLLASPESLPKLEELGPYAKAIGQRLPCMLGWLSKDGSRPLAHCSGSSGCTPYQTAGCQEQTKTDLERCNHREDDT
jgi:tetratricopeptide (TPR) repeat protein